MTRHLSPFARVAPDAGPPGSMIPRRRGGGLRAASTFASMIRKIMGALDTFLGTTLPRSIADECGCDWRVISVKSREEWRALRAQLSDDAKSRREAIE